MTRKLTGPATPLPQGIPAMMLPGGAALPAMGGLPGAASLPPIFGAGIEGHPAVAGGAVTGAAAAAAAAAATAANTPAMLLDDHGSGTVSHYARLITHCCGSSIILTISRHRHQHRPG